MTEKVLETVATMSVLGMSSLLPTECPLCEQPYEDGYLIHRKCLLEKHGGTLPEHFDELIRAFKLEPDTSES